jgi:acetyltransferase-like isoleucine patch superfamily enzyme
MVRERLGDALRWGADRASAWGAIGPDSRRARGFGSFGDHACLAFPQGPLFNERYIHIGPSTIVGPSSALSVGMAPGQVMASDPVLTIGARCVIGRGSHVVAHWRVEIGDDVHTGPYVYITDQNHRYADLGTPIGLQWPTEAAVSIGSGSWLGAHVVVLPGAQIGAHVVVAAGAVVRGTVPDRCVVAGVPARIVRRWVEGEGWIDEGGAQVDGSHGPTQAPS